MANPILGEVPFEVDGMTYRLVFDFNAICVVEETFDAPISQIGQKMAKGMRASDLRSLITSGLQLHHPGLEDLEVGVLIGKLGAQVAADKLAAAMQAAFPDKEEAKGTAGPRMNRQQRRTSKSSSPSGSN